MRFEGRDLKPYAEPISATELEVGHVYFIVQFLDDSLLVPVLEPIVYLGANLHEEDEDRHYFQDGESYVSDSDRSDALIYAQSRDNLNHIFRFDKALDVLLSCALRRSNEQKSA